MRDRTADLVSCAMETPGFGISRRACVVGLAATAAAGMAPKLCLGADDMHVLRLAISEETLAGANVSDARAAYRVWLHEISRYFGTHTVDVVPEIFIPSEDLVRGVRSGSIDCYGVTALELEKLDDLTDPDSLVIQDYLANGIEYVLLVHTGSPFQKITDLRGAQLISHLHRDMVLLPAWLSTMLAENNLPGPEKFFASHRQNDKITQVVLPVFFRRADVACLARHDWDTAVELNPQLGRDLRPLAISPKVIPIGFGFRRITRAEDRNDLIRAIQSISSYVAGQQIVALYQSRAFVIKPISAMKPTLDLVRQYVRLSDRHAGVRKGAA